MKPEKKQENLKSETSQGYTGRPYYKNSNNHNNKNNNDHHHHQQQNKRH